MHRVLRTIIWVLAVALIPVYLGAETPQALHLFSGTTPFQQVSASGAVTRDNGEYLFGTHSLMFATDGDGANVHAALTDLDPIDLRGQTVEIWVRVDEVDNLSDLWLYFGNAPDFADRVVYMVSRDRSQLVNDTWLRITLPPSEGQTWGDPDLSRMTAIQLWTNDRGTGPVTVRFDGLFLRATPDEGAVVFTFDDGWIDTVTEAAPTMERYGMPGTAYIIPELLGTPGYMTLQELRRLEDEYGWTIGAHALGPLTDGPAAERLRRIEALIDWFATNGFGETGLDLAYSNGAFDAALLELVTPRFRSARTIVEFGETIPPGDRHRIRIFNVLRQTTPDEVVAAVSRARDHNELVVLVFHRVTLEGNAETVLSPEQFTAIVDAVAATGVPVRPLPEVLGPAPYSGHIRASGTAAAAAASEIIFDEALRIDTVPPGVSAQQDVPGADGGVQRAPSEGRTPFSGPSGGSTQDPPGPSLISLAGDTPAGDSIFTFSFDWKFLLGRDADEDSTYFSQLDELFLTLARPVGEYATITGVGGVRPVVFDDLSTGAISGDDLYLDSLVLTDRLGSRLFPATGVQLDVETGYRDYYPRNKWAEVTQWSVIENPFAQDLTPKSLWIGANLRYAGFFATAAASPDFIGEKNEEGDRELTTNRTTDTAAGAGVPQYFVNLGGTFEYSLGTTLLESAVAVGGDAVKWVALAQHAHYAGPWGVGASLGWKALWGTTFETYPLWEPHEDGKYTLSAGVAPSWTHPGGITFKVGVSYAAPGNLYRTNSEPSMLGLDLRVSEQSWALFAGTATFDVTDWNYEASPARTAGWEAGASVMSGGITYSAGYTTAGFAMQSGLYGNRFANGGGDGMFLRVITTQ